LAIALAATSDDVSVISRPCHPEITLPLAGADREQHGQAQKPRRHGEETRHIIVRPQLLGAASRVELAALCAWIALDVAAGPDIPTLADNSGGHRRAADRGDRLAQ